MHYNPFNDSELIDEISKKYNQVIESIEDDRKTVIDNLKESKKIDRRDVYEQLGHTRGEKVLQELHAEGYTSGTNTIYLNDLLPERLMEARSLTDMQRAEIILYIIMFLSRRDEATYQEIYREVEEEDWGLEGRHDAKRGIDTALDRGFLESSGRDTLKVTRDGSNFIKAREESFVPDEKVNEVTESRISEHEALKVVVRIIEKIDPVKYTVNLDDVFEEYRKGKWGITTGDVHKGIQYGLAEGYLRQKGNEKIFLTLKAREIQESNEQTVEEASTDANQIAEDIKNLFYKYFPKSYCNAYFSPSIHASITVTIALASDKRDAISNIMDNDPIYSTFMIDGFNREGEVQGQIRAERIQGFGVWLKGYDKHKVQFRKTTGDVDRVMKAFDRHFSRLYQAVDQNRENLQLPDHVDVDNYLK